MLHLNLHSYVHYLIPGKVKLEQDYHIVVLLLEDAVWYFNGFLQKHGSSKVGRRFITIE
jgi:hypothetical protein